MKKTAILFYIAYTGLVIYTYYRWFGGLPPISSMTSITTLMALGFSLFHAADSFGWRKTLVFIATCIFVTLAFESIGVATGKIYGPYHYTNELGPKFLGLVPYLIPAAWIMMMYPSLVIAQSFLRSSSSRGWKMLMSAAVGATVMTAWDLVLDPLMVKFGFWVWDGSAGSRQYFGIPIQNYIGWWVTSLAVFVIFFLFSNRSRLSLGRAESRWPAIMYATIGANTILMAYLNGLAAPALIGVFAMLPWVLGVLF
jgi:uncharacterized membrane protein